MYLVVIKRITTHVIHAFQYHNVQFHREARCFLILNHLLAVSIYQSMLCYIFPFVKLLL